MRIPIENPTSYRGRNARPNWVTLALFIGVALGAGAIAAHAFMRCTGQPLPLGVLAASQLGVPVAAATLGTETHSLAPGEAPALLLGALLTIAAAAAIGPALSRTASVQTPVEPTGKAP